MSCAPSSGPVGYAIASAGVTFILLKSGMNVSLSIPQHREVAPGTLRALIRNSGMSVEEFVAFT